MKCCLGKVELDNGKLGKVRRIFEIIFLIWSHSSKRYYHQMKVDPRSYERNYMQLRKEA